jgi:hypothetical protein
LPDVRLTGFGGYEFGDISVPDSKTKTAQKDTSQWFVGGKVKLPSVWSQPYAQLAYSQGHNTGNEELYALDARLGFSPWQLLGKNTLELRYLYQNRNPYLPMPQHGFGLSWILANLAEVNIMYTRSNLESPMPGYSQEFDQVIFGADLGRGLEWLIAGPRNEED